MKRLLPALGAAFILTSSATAVGQPRTEAARADSWFRRGVAQARANDNDAARESFAAAYALVSSVDILWNLAATERKCGRIMDARNHLRAYVSSAQARADRAIVAREWIAELETQIARIDIKASPDVTVAVDGDARDTGEIETVAGVHVVTFKRGDEAKSVAVTAQAGMTTAIAMPVAEAPAATSKPETSIETPTPPTIVVLPPVRASYPSSSSRTWTVVGLAAGGIAAVAGGVLLGAAAGGARDDADRAHATMQASGFSCKRAASLCDDYESSRTAAQRLEAGSTGLYVVGGVLAGAAVVSWIFWPRAEIAPSVGKNGASITASGSF